MGTGDCVAILDGDASASGVVGLVPCAAAAAYDDGRAVFSLSQSGQLRVHLGGGCLVARGGRLAVQACAAAAQSTNGGGIFISVPVPEHDLGSAVAARMSAELALRTASRLSGQISELKHSLPYLPGCTSRPGRSEAAAIEPPPVAERASSTERIDARATFAAGGLQDSDAIAVAVTRKLGVGDMSHAIAEARAVIADVRRKL